jgi:Cyclin, C-terminal domain
MALLDGVHISENNIVKCESLLL